MATDYNADTKLYTWQNPTIDDAYLQKFAAGGVNAVGVPKGWGAQQAGAVQKLTQQISAAADASYAKAKASLAAQGINLDAYVDPTYQLYDAGEGASSNRMAPAEIAAAKTKAQQDAIAMASSGKPAPDFKTKLQGMLNDAQGIATKAYRDPTYKAQVQKIQNLMNGYDVNANLDPAYIKQQNAAAARVGAPLPFANGEIGDVQPGGLFSSAAEAQQYYKNGQLDQTALDQRPANQMAANAAKSGATPAAGATGTQANSQNYSQGAQDLVKQVLMSGQNVTDLQQLPFWANNPNKQEAYTMLQNVFSSPQNLASYVQTNGIQNLQQMPWWNSYPQKQDAWNVIQSGQTNTGNTQNGTQQGATGTGPNGTQTSGQAGGAAGTTTQPSGALGDAQASQQKALDIINSSNLDETTKSLYRDAVNKWNPADEINVPNVLKTFSQIQASTIDPYFKELTNTAINQIQSDAGYTNSNRQLELEQQGMNADKSLRDTRSNLEASGLTFSGEGVRQLGAQSAYAQPGANPNNAMPVQQELPGGGFAQGLVNEQNQVIASSSAARYQKGIQDIQRSAEQQLGSAAASGLVPGATQIGGIDQSAQLPYQKQQSAAGTLQSLYSQEQQNAQARQPITPFSTTST